MRTNSAQEFLDDLMQAMEHQMLQDMKKEFKSEMMTKAEKVIESILSQTLPSLQAVIRKDIKRDQLYVEIHLHAKSEVKNDP